MRFPGSIPSQAHGENRENPFFSSSRVPENPSCATRAVARFGVRGPDSLLSREKFVYFGCCFRKHSFYLSPLMLARLVASHPLPLCQSVSKSYRKIRPVNVVIHETGKVYGDGEGAAHLAATRVTSLKRMKMMMTKPTTCSLQDISCMPMITRFWPSPSSPVWHKG